MATTCVTIYSQYDPERDKERLQHETGQSPVPQPTAEVDDEHLWREAASAQFLRAQRPPPKFVPAAVSYEIFSGEPRPSKQSVSCQENYLGTSLSTWYRSLTKVDCEPSSNATLPPRPSSAPILTTVMRAEKAKKDSSRCPITRDKNTWFIEKVLVSESSSGPSRSTPTLTDILTREPPPLPSEPKYTPPVWVEIGPANKGFTMLQKGGWREGEGLGLGARRRPSPRSSQGTITSTKAKNGAVAVETPVDRASRVIKHEFCDYLGDVENEGIDVIDLTLSDSETSSEAEKTLMMAELCELPQGPEYPAPEDVEDTLAHGRRALLTPIATVLKLDRLGIGLKARTEGPYKASVKRVTHNATSLAAHARAAEEARRRRENFGRGRRGYERQKRREEDRRRELLAYMNT